jgi:O-succinylbenzoic acid--CoA ligase
LIDWQSDDAHVLLNPRMAPSEKERLERAVPQWKRMIYVATSGTTGSLKLVALTKDAVLASAAAVNRRLNATAADVWCRVLPSFHVGGLGIEARAFLCGSRFIDLPWDVEKFVHSAATLASLVSTQVYDLVRAEARAPAGLRHVLVGGGAFDPQLQESARSLGWPVLATYGMSECASTVAVEGQLLDHLEARREPDGRVALRGSSVLKAYVLADGTVHDPKVNGWFISDDLGEVRQRELIVYGRSIDFIKIGGESVDLNRLDRILKSVRRAGEPDAAIVAVRDDRLGHVIHLAATGDASRLVEAYDAQVHPFERVRKVHQVAQIPRTSLGKLLRGELTRIVE